MLPIVLPPIEEQEALIRLWGEQVELIQTGIDGIAKDIELAREHRVRLIADVVTGKVDVRGLAFAMPEAFDDDDIEDDFEDGDGDLFEDEMEAEEMNDE